jgi:bacillithiol biosynthesis cysteine-adding enzyme BshC
MKFSSTQIPYSETGLFSPLVRDYIQSKGAALKYTTYAPTYEGVAAAIAARANFKTDRNVLVTVLQKQYDTLAVQTSNTNQTAAKTIHAAVKANIDLLAKKNTYVVTTAHQPNIFTGPLYFFYKIIHAIQLAADLKVKYPANNFVPVYYMGSEDADIDEVGSFVLGGTKHNWVTKQTGAIGRMKVDDALVSLMQNLEGYWSVKGAGKTALDILKQAYQKGHTINEATLSLVDAYFGQYGLLVLQPDDAALKSLFIPVMEKELKEQFSHAAIQPTLKSLTTEYHVQSEGRSLNLFYLKDHLRARIEKQGAEYIIVDTDLKFTQEEIIKELHAFPERFSPNVILRGVYQELILPGVVFIGGGGELAYWMELKNVFEAVGVHYPVLQLRNSFAIIREKQMAQWAGLGLSLSDLFKPVLDIEVLFVKQKATESLSLASQLKELQKLYDQIKVDVIKVDPTLGDHAMNLAHQSEKKILELEKKMVRAERRKETVNIERIHAIKQSLFPMNSLQERVENIAEWIGDYDWAWVEAVMQHSNTMEHSFTIIDISA